jgi:putative ABC transport system permease protein
MSEVPRKSRTVGGYGKTAAEIRDDHDLEVEFHISMRVEELVRAGESALSARERALREYGDLENARRLLTHADSRVERKQRRRAWTADWSFDFKFAFRSLLKDPGFALVAVLTLGLGMGATTSIFSIVNAYLLRPLPFPAADRLVVLNDLQPNYGPAPASFEEFTDWSTARRPYEVMAAYSRRSRNYIGGEYPERVRVSAVSHDYFTLVAPSVVTGRLFSSDEHREGAPRVIVLSESFWRSRLGASNSAVGSALNLDGVPFTVIGVIRDFPDFAQLDPTVGWMTLETNAPYRDRGTHYLTVWAREPAGRTAAAIKAETDQVVKRLQTERDTDHGIESTSIRTLLVGETRPMLLAMMVTVVFVLLIATVNVANLLLSRAARRQQEFAVRSALGAGRVRLLRQLIVEGLVLSMVGGVVGVLTGTIGTPLLLSALPPGMPRPPVVGLDVRVLGFAAATVVIAALLFGLAPILVETRSNLASLMKASRSGSGFTRVNKLSRQGLVVLELALSMMMLVGAGLTVRSFSRLAHVEPGFRPDGLFSFALSLPGTRYNSPEKRLAFFEDLEARLSRLPGVEAIAGASNLPLTGAGQNGDFHVEGRPDESVDEQPVAEKRVVTPSYLATLGVRLVEGRNFTPQDRIGAPRVVLINQTMANRIWPGKSPLGQRLNSMSPDSQWEEVIGVFSDVRVNGLDHAAPLEILHPLAIHATSGLNIVVRSRSELDLMPQIRREVSSLDPQLPLYNVIAMPEVIERTVAGRKLLLLLSTGFGLLALLLAGIGTAGVIAYGVTRRTREIGVRLALGSPPRAVLGLVVREGMTLAIAGMLLGVLGAFALGGALQAQLFEVTARDPVTYIAAALALLLAAVAATYVPARKVLRFDPLIAIRAE